MIKVKARETLLNIGKYAGDYRFILSPELYTTLSEDMVLNEAALRSGVRRQLVKAVAEGIGEVIKAWATTGHCVPVPGLGSMRFGLRADSVESVDKVKSDLISARRVIFIPSVSIKEELEKTGINITCYDRDGNVIKTVTNQSGAVEDNTEEGENFTLTVNASPANGGSVTGAGSYKEGDEASLNAVPASGYVFKEWNDGNTDATRTVTVSGDATYTATFTTDTSGGGDEEDGGSLVG